MIVFDEIGRLTQGLRQAEATHQRLSETYLELEHAFQRLVAPPLYPATFLEMQDHGGEPSALVHYNGAFRLVHLAEGFEPADVQTGDRVLISGDLNIVVGTMSGGALDCGETAIFERYTADGRLVVSCRDEEVIVKPAKGLNEAKLKAGDEVRWSHSALVAFEKVERGSAEQFYLEEAPDATFDDIGGHDTVIDTLKQTFLIHVLHAERAKAYRLEPVRSVFLYGPPGVGKTMLVKGLVNWLREISPSGRAKFINVTPGQLESMWFSMTEKNIREFFDAVGEVAAEDPRMPVVVFFDEVDWIATARGGHLFRADDKAVQAFAAALQGMKSRGNVLIISATNRRDILDGAIIRAGRLGDRVIKVGRPNRAAAQAILSKLLREDMPYAAGMDADGDAADPEASASSPHVGGQDTAHGPSNAKARAGIIQATLSTLFSPNGDGNICRLMFRDGSERTVRIADVLTGATLAKIVRDASQRALLREIVTGEPGIRMEDLSAALAEEIESVAGLLTPANCSHHLSDLPQDVDVVSVVPVRRKPADTLRYLRAA
jgi:proteasome ATPase